MVVFQAASRSGKRNIAKKLERVRMMYLSLKYKYLILTLVVFILPYFMMTIIYINNVGEYQKKLLIETRLEVLKKIHYFNSSFESNQASTKVYHEVLNSIWGSYSDFLLLTEQKDIKFSTNSHISEHEEYFLKLEPQKTNYYKIDYLNVERILMYSFDSFNNCYYVVIATSDSIFKEVNNKKEDLMAFAIASTLLLTIITFLYSNKISTTLQMLIERITSYRKAIYHFEDKEKKHVWINDELDIASHELNQTIAYMVEKEKGYVRENYEAQLNNLQSQINPHFLYNTLDNINQLAMIHEVEEISTLSVGLAKLFRYNTGNSENETTIEKELEIIEEYINIMKIRISYLLFDIQIEENDLLQNAILKFTLQPIVENIFKHGYNHKEALSINIKIYRKKNYVIIETYNKSEYNDTARIAMLNDKMNEENHEGSIGLKNVNRRLKIKYGEAYGVMVLVNEQQYFVSRILLPYKK